jgi:hypothetical protein
MKWIAKMLELIGMVIVLAGLLYGINYSLIKFELNALVIGGMVFCAGWLLEKKV